MAANHPQLGAALSNVADLNRIYREHQRESAALAEAARRGGAVASSRDGGRDDDSRRAKKRGKGKGKKDGKRSKEDGKGKKRKRVGEASAEVSNGTVSAARASPRGFKSCLELLL